MLAAFSNYKKVDVCTLLYPPFHLIIHYACNNPCQAPHLLGLRPSPQIDNDIKPKAVMPGRSLAYQESPTINLYCLKVDH